MHKLGEQWIVEIDGVRHMLKAVETINKTCEGCRYNDDMGKCACKYFIECCQGEDYIIRDLGPVNEDGFLACPFCGEYPEFIIGGFDRKSLILHHKHFNGLSGHACNYHVGKHGRQQAIDAWNRRA